MKMTKAKWIAEAPLRQVRYRIAQLKSDLVATDYKAIKYAEGWITETEYAPIKARRQALRNEINQIESQIEAMRNGGDENGLE